LGAPIQVTEVDRRNWIAWWRILANFIHKTYQRRTLLNRFLARWPAEQGLVGKVSVSGCAVSECPAGQLKGSPHYMPIPLVFWVSGNGVWQSLPLTGWLV